MIQIREIKRTLTAMREVKDFDDNAYFKLVGDPRLASSDYVSKAHVEFQQGNVHVTLEAPIYEREGAE